MRQVHASTAAALAAGNLFPAILYEGEFADGASVEMVRLWTGVGALTWGGRTFLGGGELLGISPIEESSEMRATGFAVSLNGIPSLHVWRALAAIRQGRPATLWLAMLTDAGAIIGDPVVLQGGRLDTSVMSDDGDSATVTVSYESHLVDLERPRLRYYTPEDQHIEFPADRGFSQVAALQDMELVWGP